MSKDKKKFRDTTVGKFLTENAPDVLATISDTVDDYFPPVKIITTLLKGTALPPEKQAELDKLLLDYEKEFFALSVQDRASARDLQKTALSQNDTFAKRYLYYLSSFVVLSATAFGVMLFFLEFPESNRRMIEMFVDIYLFAGALMVLQFFFGSSAGSRDKDHIIKTLRL